MQSEVKPTALEEKWEKNKSSGPSLDDAYSDDGKIKEGGVSEEIMSLIPQPTGWRIALLPYRGAAVTKGGIMLAKETKERTQLATNVGYVLKMGPLAYADESKFPYGAWCQVGNWVIFGRYAGSRIPIDGGEIRLLNDDEILATVSDPENVLHM